jgi:hypothetical protein
LNLPSDIYSSFSRRLILFSDYANKPMLIFAGAWFDIAEIPSDSRSGDLCVIADIALLLASLDLNRISSLDLTGDI